MRVFRLSIKMMHTETESKTIGRYPYDVNESRICLGHNEYKDVEKEACTQYRSTGNEGTKRCKTGKDVVTRGFQKLSVCHLETIASFLYIPDLPAWWRLSIRVRDLDICRVLAHTFLGPNVLSQLQVHMPQTDIARLVMPSLKAKWKNMNTKRTGVYVEPPKLSQFVFRLEMEATGVSYILKARFVIANTLEIHASHITEDENYYEEDIGIVIDLDPDIVPAQILEVCQVRGEYMVGSNMEEHIDAMITDNANPWKFNIHVIDTHTAKTELLFGDCFLSGRVHSSTHKDTRFVDYETRAENTIPAETRTNLHMSQIVRERLTERDTREGQTAHIVWTGIYFQLYDLDETVPTDTFLSP